MNKIFTNNFKKRLIYLISFFIVIFTHSVNAQCTMTASATSVDESCAGACDGSVSVNVSSSACVSVDTVIASTHLSNYTSTMTRGYFFQAQSSFNISVNPIIAFKGVLYSWLILARN